MRTKMFAPILIAIMALTACSSTPPTEPTAPVVVQEETETPTPVETEPTVEETLEPEVDEYSQIIDGVVYQGTEKAPVRIGDSEPGKAPRLQAERPELSELNRAAVEAGKYKVQVGKDTDGKWYWSAGGESQHGGYKNLAMSFEVHGFEAGKYPDRATAMAQDFIVDGRVLDRSEYVLLIQDGMEFVYADD